MSGCWRHQKQSTKLVSNTVQLLWLELHSEEQIKLYFIKYWNSGDVKSCPLFLAKLQLVQTTVRKRPKWLFIYESNWYPVQSLNMLPNLGNISIGGRFDLKDVSLVLMLLLTKLRPLCRFLCFIFTTFRLIYLLFINSCIFKCCVSIWIFLDISVLYNRTKPVLLLLLYTVESARL